MLSSLKGTKSDTRSFFNKYYSRLRGEMKKGQANNEFKKKKVYRDYCFEYTKILIIR